MTGHLDLQPVSTKSSAPLMMLILAAMCVRIQLRNPTSVGCAVVRCRSLSTSTSRRQRRCRIDVFRKGLCERDYPNFRLSGEPRNRAVMDVVAARELAEGFLAGGDALPCLLPLVRGELGLAAELDAFGNGAGASFGGA